MEEHLEKLDYVNQLMPFIRFPNAKYSEWTYQPLAENFKQEDAWKLYLVPSLFSSNPTICQEAQKNCETLLQEINKYQQSIQTKQAKMRLNQCCGICLPISLLATQMFLGFYGSLPTIITAKATHECTKKLGDFDTLDQAYQRHEQQLNLIKDEISEIITKSNEKDNDPRKKILLDLIKIHTENATKHIKSSQILIDSLVNYTKKND